MADGDLSELRYFEVNLKTGMVVDESDYQLFSSHGCSVMYSHLGSNIYEVQVGDGHRHSMGFSKKYWNRLLRIITDDELDQSGMELIIDHFMGSCLYDSTCRKNFISGIKSGQIKPR